VNFLNSFMAPSNIASKFVYSMLQDLIVTFCLLMVIEGLLPFISPKTWKNMMESVTKQTDRNIRVFAFISMLIGSVTIYIIRS